MLGPLLAGQAPRRQQRPAVAGWDLNVAEEAQKCFDELRAISEESAAPSPELKRKRGGQNLLSRLEPRMIPPKQLTALKTNEDIMAGISQIDEAAGVVYCKLCGIRLAARTPANRYTIRIHIQQKCRFVKLALQKSKVTSRNVFEAFASAKPRKKHKTRTWLISAAPATQADLVSQAQPVSGSLSLMSAYQQQKLCSLT